MNCTSIWRLLLHLEYNSYKYPHITIDVIADIYEWEMGPATITIGSNAIRVSAHLVPSGICASTVHFIAELGLADFLGEQ